MNANFGLASTASAAESTTLKCTTATLRRQQAPGLRVAFLGNMNNNHFSMARFLRERGVAADVLLFDHLPDHFHPSADTYDLGYTAFTHRLRWGSAGRFLSTTPEDVRRDLAPYQVLIGCGLAPAYCERAGRSLDVFVPYGADIWEYTFFRLVTPHHMPSTWAAAVYQRLGIRRARILHMAVTNELLEKRCSELRPSGQRWFEGLPMVHTGTYSKDVLRGMSTRTHWAHEFAALRQRYELMVLCHARHKWNCSARDPNAKGTDKLLRGWALFRQRHPEKRAVLVTLEYGDDVLASKELARELKIEDSVAWLPRMNRKDIMVGLQMADVVCGEFENSWMTSGVLYEALAMAKPILAWRNDALYGSSYPNLYPIMCAKDPQSIASRLHEYLADPQRHAEMGEQGYRWYQEEIVAKSVSRYVAYINERSAQFAV